MNTSEQLDRVIDGKSKARDITHKAKHLTYPITDICVELSTLASECGLEEEMEDYLDEVRQAQNKVESAFFNCEDVFTDKKSELECKLLDDILHEEVE
jgi:hypothetical protein